MCPFFRETPSVNQVNRNAPTLWAALPEFRPNTGFGGGIHSCFENPNLFLSSRLQAGGIGPCVKQTTLPTQKFQTPHTFPLVAFPATWN